MAAKRTEVKARGLILVKQQLARLAKATKVPTIQIKIPASEAVKLNRLIEGGGNLPARDIGEPNELLVKEMVRAFKAALPDVIRGKKDYKAAWKAAGEAYLRRLTLRVRNSGGDLKSSLAKLAPSTIARKGSSRMFVDTGALLSALESATVVVVER